DETKLLLKTAQEAWHSAQAQIAEFREKLGSLSAEGQAKQQRLDELQSEHGRLRNQCTALIENDGQLKAAVSELNAKLEAEHKQSSEKVAVLTQAREELSNQFKTLANEILEEKAKKFTEQTQTNLNQRLEP